MTSISSMTLALALGLMPFSPTLTTRMLASWLHALRARSGLHSTLVISPHEFEAALGSAMSRPQRSSYEPPLLMPSVDSMNSYGSAKTSTWSGDSIKPDGGAGMSHRRRSGMIPDGHSLNAFDNTPNTDRRRLLSPFVTRGSCHQCTAAAGPLESGQPRSAATLQSHADLL